MKLGQNIVWMKSRTSLKIKYVGSKTRSLGQILEKPCVRSRGQIFSLIIMKLGQNIVLITSRMTLKMSHVGGKTKSVGQILEKLCVCSRATFSVQ